MGSDVTVKDESGLESPAEAVVSALAYVMLAVLGAVYGLVGSFVQDWTVREVPLASIVLVVLLFGLVRLAGWGMGGRTGAVIPAFLWLIVVFVMSLQRPEGDLVVPATIAGYVYIIGGLLAAVLGVMRVPPSGGSGQWLLRGTARTRG
ncbi:DUF6113 family protein [Actinomadura algeriensis]|uniref:Integral membrane protein n=1 Tax=Actinomadura algeriensis TaxID=1679523 RepID=A0ABR9JUG0_9ACTN|nr:DUF6113 family protein [Actinomadura algeriensis]MBE1534199.1 hypothetical protein [Actinomadura algeriensis]